MTSAVYTHMKLRHPRCKDSPFQCVVDGCDEPFNDRMTMRRHITDDHNIDAAQDRDIKAKIYNLHLSSTTGGHVIYGRFR